MTDKPNIIICLCDQMRAFDVGCYGNEIVRTPNIDKLAQSGTRFECAISNNPLCVPSRSSLLSGQYSRTCTGSTENQYADNGPVMHRERIKNITIAEQLKEAGYKTGLIGKWHIHPHPLLLGFDDAIFPEVIHCYQGQRYYENYDKQFTVNEFTSEFEIKQVEKFIDKNKDEPFFLYYNISPPHQPVFKGIPEKYRTMYDKNDVIIRDNAYTDEGLSYSDFWFRTYMYVNFFWDHLKDSTKIDYDKYPLPAEFDLRDLTALYYGMITSVDDMVGRMMNALTKNGIDDNTIIVFLSDHGDNLGSHNMFNKGELIEESIRVPMIYYYPGIIQKQIQKEQIASIIDVMPSLLDLAEIEVPASVQGRSLKPILTNTNSIFNKNQAFIETPRGKIGIRTKDFLYGIELTADNRQIKNDSLCLYDLKSDPFEMENLVKSDKYQDIKEELRVQLTNWHLKTPWLATT